MMTNAVRQVGAGATAVTRPFNDPAQQELRLFAPPPEGERRRPELRPCPAAVPGPPDGTLPGDLRAVLFELTTEPGRIKQDGALYPRDTERLPAALAPMPGFDVDRFYWY